MRIIPNQSEKRFVSRLIKNGQKSTRPNPIQSEATIRQFRFGLILIQNLVADWFALLLWIKAD